VFWAVNGYLLGREYFELVAMRHHGRQEARDMRKQNGGRVFLSGCIVAVLFTAPVLNLAALVIGVAAMVHLHCVMVLGRAGAA
jgi:CysZ protein